MEALKDALTTLWTPHHTARQGICVHALLPLQVNGSKGLRILVDLQLSHHLPPDSLYRGLHPCRDSENIRLTAWNMDCLY